jgi:ribonuclease P protein component
MRLSGERAFSAVFAEQVRRGSGPLVLYARPNTVGHHRLGLTVPRRVGSAVRRNRIKRLIREAFRLQQHELPGSYDLVVVVRPHPPAALADYMERLALAQRGLDEAWRRRG